MTTNARIAVLDHGYVQFVEAWGRGLDGQMEAAIIEAARMSTGKGFQGWEPHQCPRCATSNTPGTIEGGDEGDTLVQCPSCKGTGQIPGDEKLLKYLWTHKHTTPFEMAGLTIEVQAPIFVFREWHRHRTQSYNEMSARYTPLPDVNYVPSIERVMTRGSANKQATGTGQELTAFHANAFIINLKKSYSEAENQYQTALADGVPKELARCFLPVGRYSRMRASANLLNWLKFLTLRTAPDAQWEIRQYAEAVAGMIAGLFPRTHALWWRLPHASTV